MTTSSLVSSNDNHSQGDHRALTAGHHAAVMAALAAAGLEAEDNLFDRHLLGHDSNAHSEKVQQFEALVAASAHQALGSAAPTHIVQSIVASNVVEPANVGGHHASETLGHQQADHGSTARPLIGELLHGIAHGAHVPVATANPIMAPSVAMPSAQQLVAALGGHSQTTSVGGEDHHQAVSQVLADALHGGEGQGPSIDALVNSHGGHVTHDVIEALASHAGSAVPYSNIGLAAAFHGTHNMFQMAMTHHDAAPHHG